MYFRPHRAALSIVALIAVVAAACARASTSPDSLVPSTAVGHDVAITRDITTGWPADPVTIAASELAADTLVLTVTYGGGCQDHLVRLIAGDAWMESSPVAVGLRLAHDARGDVCKALVTRTLRVNLAPLRDAYLRVYGAAADRRIRLSLAGAPTSLIYRF